TLCRRCRRLPRLQGPRWNLPECFSHDGTAVTKQANVLRIQEGQDRHRPWVEHDVALDGLAVRKHRGIDGDLDFAASINNLPGHKDSVCFRDESTPAKQRRS